MSAQIVATITEQDIDRQREALCDWVKANGIDPYDVAAAPGLTVERTARGLVIVWHQFQRDDQGRCLRCPDAPAEAWTVRKATRMTSPPDDHGLPKITLSDHYSE